jgi:lysophospholipase L1-like esterase
MKFLRKIYLIIIAFALVTATSCTYDFPPEVELTSGSADFTKVVAVGNSLTAGYMNGALYDAGQASSFANIVATQIKLNGGGEFNQPDIESPLGNFGTASGIPGVPDGTPLGRLHLVNPASPVPQPFIPGDPFNTSYSGDKSLLNNFGVPGMRIVDVTFPGYGVANPYFGRYASDAATASVLGDAIAANGSFILFWLGSNDALGYALGGATADPEGDGSNPADMTQAAIFDIAYKTAIAALITDGKKGIVANIPNINDIPHFTTVPWNAIPMDQATADGTNLAYSPYNGGLDAMVANQLLTQEEADLRYIVFKEGANGAVIFDNSLTDLTIYDPGLVSMRMANANDLLTLTSGAVLGTLANPADPTSVIGVGVPLGEQYTLIEEDQIAIADRIVDFNAIIASEVTASNGNLVLMDMNAEFFRFSTEDIDINGAGVDTSIIPPFGLFSLDGIHPNQRGAAYVASLFIDKINEAFGANIPNVNPNNWPGNEVPVP